MKKVSLILCFVILLSSVVYAGEQFSLGNGETKEINGNTLKISRISDTRKVSMIINNEEVLVRKGMDHKYEFADGSFIYLDVALHNYLDPSKSQAHFLYVDGNEVVKSDEENVGVSGSPKDSYEHVILKSGETQVLNGVSVGFVRIRETSAYLMINDNEVKMEKDDIYETPQLYFSLESLMDNTLDSKYDRVDLLVDLKSKEEGKPLDVQRVSEIKSAPKLTPVKKEPKVDEEKKEELIFEDLPQPDEVDEEKEETDSEEEGFFSKWFGWILFWK